MPHIIVVDRANSSNKYALENVDFSQTEEFTVVRVEDQFAGKGQLDAVWESEPHKNFTFSLILYPTFLDPAKQFMLAKVLSIGVANYLQTIIPQQSINIKWPNDIYVDGKKICGMLTHNRILGQTFGVAVAGIGLNMNQTTFTEQAPNAISLKNITQQNYSLEKELEKLVGHIKESYLELKQGDSNKIDKQYFSLLLNYQKEASYLFRGKQIQASITGVSEFGFLQLKTATAEEIECDIKEIQFL